MRYKGRVVVVLLVGAWLLSKTIGSLRGVTHEWGPKVGGYLKDGRYVYFQARKVGGGTEDKLVLSDPRWGDTTYLVDQIHYGFLHVKIRASADFGRVWVESDGKIGASLDISTGEFWPEAYTQPEWAKYGNGELIAEGDTRTVGQLLWEVVSP